MSYLIGASRMKLMKLPHMEPGTRVSATRRIPSGPCHAVEGMDATKALCGAEVIEVLDEVFTAETELLRCEDCEKLVKQD